MIASSKIAGSGSFAEQAKRIAASEHLYRLALSLELVETMSALLLGFALYVTLRPVNELVARLAMFFRMAESIAGAVGMMFAFARLRLYLDGTESVVGFTLGAGNASYNISALFFGVGSILFFYVFSRSTIIPKMLSIFGIISSLIVPVICFGDLIFPEYAAKLQYGWAPMALAEVVTGIWLMVAPRIGHDENHG